MEKGKSTDEKKSPLQFVNSQSNSRCTGPLGKLRWWKTVRVRWFGRILNGCEKGSQNITSSYGHHEKNITFITSGRRPRVINVIFSSDDHNYE